MTTPIPKSFKLEHNGSDWCGTFQVVLAAALDNFLEDGDPIAVTFTLERLQTPVEAIVTHRDGVDIHIQGGESIDISAVLGIEVS